MPVRGLVDHRFAKDIDHASCQVLFPRHRWSASRISPYSSSISIFQRVLESQMGSCICCVEEDVMWWNGETRLERKRKGSASSAYFGNGSTGLQRFWGAILPEYRCPKGLLFKRFDRTQKPRTWKHHFSLDDRFLVLTASLHSWQCDGFLPQNPHVVLQPPA